MVNKFDSFIEQLKINNGLKLVEVGFDEKFCHW